MHATHMACTIADTIWTLIFLSWTVAAYTITSVDVAHSDCRPYVVADTMLTVRWALDNATAAKHNWCYVAVRSPANSADDKVYVADAHVPCDWAKYNLRIPKTSQDLSMRFNSSDYNVQFITSVHVNHLGGGSHVPVRVASGGLQCAADLEYGTCAGGGGLGRPASGIFRRVGDLAATALATSKGRSVDGCRAYGGTFRSAEVPKIYVADFYADEVH